MHYAVVHKTKANFEIVFITNLILISPTNSSNLLRKPTEKYAFQITLDFILPLTEPRQMKDTPKSRSWIYISLILATILKSVFWIQNCIDMIHPYIGKLSEFAHSLWNISNHLFNIPES
jgi:hypothetical protein